VLSTIGELIKNAASVETQQLPTDIITQANTYLDWMIMGFARHLDGGNPLRVAIEYEGPTYFDLPDKQCRLKVEIHDGSLYGDLAMVLNTPLEFLNPLIKPVMNSLSRARVKAT